MKKGLFIYFFQNREKFEKMSLKQLVGQSKLTQILRIFCKNHFLEIMTDVIKAQRQNDKWKVLVLGLFMNPKAMKHSVKSRKSKS